MLLLGLIYLISCDLISMEFYSDSESCDGDWFQKIMVSTEVCFLDTDRTESYIYSIENEEAFRISFDSFYNCKLYLNEGEIGYNTTSIGAFKHCTDNLDKYSSLYYLKVATVGSYSAFISGVTISSKDIVILEYSDECSTEIVKATIIRSYEDGGASHKNAYSEEEAECESFQKTSKCTQTNYLTYYKLYCGNQPWTSEVNVAVLVIAIFFGTATPIVLILIVIVASVAAIVFLKKKAKERKEREEKIKKMKKRKTRKVKKKKKKKKKKNENKENLKEEEIKLEEKDDANDLLLEKKKLRRGFGSIPQNELFDVKQKKLGE